MKTIKTLTKNNYTLEHSRMRVDGILRDSFTLIKTEKNGDKLHIPMLPKIKVFNKDDNLLDATSDYTEQEYKEMLNEEIEKL